MRRLLALVAIAVTLEACAEDPNMAATDMFGNIYPVACQRDLSNVKTPDGKSPVIIPSSPEVLEKIARARHTRGRLYAITTYRRMIMIDNTLIGWAYQDVLHHEQCHVLVGQWHKDDRMP